MDVFLFPLVNVTLFPKTTKPLHIFEARYLQMVQKAVETGTPLALGFIEDPAMVGPVAIGEVVPFVQRVAGYGTVQVIEERPNGTMLVFVQGIGKCRLGNVKSAQPFVVCEAEVIQENSSVDAKSLKQLEKLQKILTRWISTHITDAHQRELFLKNLEGAEEVVGAFASYLVRDYDLQQLVLEFSTMTEKIDYLFRLAESGEITL